MWRSKELQKNVLETFKPNTEFIVFDTETTGLKPDVDRVIEFAAKRIRIDEDAHLIEVAAIDAFIRPPFFVEKRITELTGITNEFLSTKPEEAEVFPKIKAFFGENPVILAYNSKFDINFMTHMYKRNGAEFTYAKQFDVLEMSRDLVEKKDVENFKLGTIVEFYGCNHGLTFHQAIDDVEATVRLVRYFFEEYKSRESDDANKLYCRVTGVHYWEGWKGFSRIYVNTTSGSVFYDIRNHVWKGKDVDPDIIDMETVQKEAFCIAGCSDLQGFARYRG